MSRAASLVNPVLARELTERMRGPRAMVMLSGYLVVLGLVLVLVYRSKVDAANSRFGGSPVVELATAGQGIFEWTLLFTMLLVLFLVPGFTAGSVVGERERQTLMPMQVSLLRPRSIILGKLGASVVFTLLLVLATLPLLTVAYLIGGVTFPEIVKGLAMVMFTAVGIGAISLACSAVSSKPFEPGRTGTPALLMVRLASDLSPIKRIARGVGPMNLMWHASHTSAR